MRSTIPAAIAVLALLAAGAVYFLSEAPGQPGAQQPPTPAGQAPEPRRPPPPKAMTARLPAPQPVASPTAVERMFRLPDGSFLPALNGVQADGAQLKWGAGPFSPVDYRFRDQDGVEWYRLKNGDFLTTVNAPGTEGHPPREVIRPIFVRYQDTGVLPVADPLDVEIDGTKK